MPEERTGDKGGAATSEKWLPGWGRAGSIARDPAFFGHWAILFLFWIVLSSFFDVLHLGSGIVCTGIVALASYDMQFVTGRHPDRRSFHLVRVPWVRLTRYSIWLMREIVIANWDVLRVVLDPSLPIDPVMIRFRTRLSSDIGKTTFANSITLTPGTITVDVVDDEFLVHALVGGEPVVGGITRIERAILHALPELEPPPEDPA